MHANVYPVHIEVPKVANNSLLSNKSYTFSIGVDFIYLV